MIRTCSINESLMLNPSRSISKSPFESHFYFSFKYVFLQQFQFVSAILARTTTSLDDQGSSRSHHFLRFWKAKPASSSTRTSVQSPMDIHLQQMHWTSGLLLWAEASVSQASFSCTGSTGCACLESYVQRIFSVCGHLTAGRRKRMNTSLEMRACLKLNSRVLKATWICVFVVQFAKTSHSWNYLKLKWLFPAILIYYTRKLRYRWQTRATRKPAKNCSNSTCLQRCRWQYWPIFMRLAAVASEICEIPRNSLKIKTYKV